jgi:hypothetical protein
MVRKARRLRRHMKVWDINFEGAYRKEKGDILAKLDTLDKKMRRICSVLWRKSYR